MIELKRSTTCKKSQAGEVLEDEHGPFKPKKRERYPTPVLSRD